MGKPKSPKPPDPIATAGAQTSTNIGTALAEQMMNMTGQVTPYGSLSYDQTGTYDYRDPLTGRVYNLPRFTANQTLAPGQQAIFDQFQGGQLNLAELFNDRSAWAQDYLNTPFSLGNEATEARLFELGRGRLDPMFAEREQQLRTDLANRGITEGSEGWQREMQRFGQGQNDAYNQLLLTGRSQAANEALTERNQPLNEILALMSGSQVQQPNFVNTPQSQLPTVDYAGLVQNNYQNQMNAYNQQMAGRQNLLGGLFGLGAGLLSGGAGGALFGPRVYPGLM